MLLRIIAFSIGSIVAILAVGTILPDEIAYGKEQDVVLFGLALGVLTTFVKPVLSALTLPISCLTFGAFSLVVNAFLFWAAARIVPDLDVTPIGALVGGVFAVIINGVVYSVVDEKK